MKKYIKKIIVIFVLALVLGIFLLTNVFVPCKTGNVELSITDNFKESDEKYVDDMFNSLVDIYEGKEETSFVNDEQLIRTNRELPSDKAKDYETICVNLNVKNRSIFSLDNFSGTVEINDPDSRVLFTYGNEVTEKVSPLSEDMVSVIWLEMYCGDLTREELLEYIRGLDIIIYYESSIAGVKQEKVSLQEAVYR